MDVDFADARIRALCESQRAANRTLGTNSARRLRARISDLMAASKVGDLVAGGPHPLKGDREGQFAVSLAGGHRLVFRPNEEPPPTLDSGQFDWPNVTSVMITFVGDYHD